MQGTRSQSFNLFQKAAQRARDAGKFTDRIGLGLARGAVPHVAFEVPALGPAVANQRRQAVAQNIRPPLVPGGHRQVLEHLFESCAGVAAVSLPLVLVDEAPGPAEAVFVVQDKPEGESGLGVGTDWLGEEEEARRYLAEYEKRRLSPGQPEYAERVCMGFCEKSLKGIRGEGPLGRTRPVVFEKLYVALKKMLSRWRSSTNLIAKTWLAWW